MIVVSDTSPLLNLAVIGQLDLLERLYLRVLLPQAVRQELSAVNPEFFAPSEWQKFPWLEVLFVSNQSLTTSLLTELDPGEAETLVLAVEQKADLLLLDERRGRKVASRFGLRYTGLLGVLIEAKSKDLIAAVKPILDDLIIKAGFWISSDLYNKILEAAGEKK